MFLWFSYNLGTLRSRSLHCANEQPLNHIFLGSWLPESPAWGAIMLESGFGSLKAFWFPERSCGNRPFRKPRAQKVALGNEQFRALQGFYRGSTGALQRLYRGSIGQKTLCDFLFFSYFLLGLYSIIFGLNWSIKTLELLLILFSVN